MRHINSWKVFESDQLPQSMLNNILDKISKNGVDSLSNYETNLLGSMSDKSVDVAKEIQKHQKKYKLSKDVITDIFPTFQVKNNEMEENIGRYVIYDMDKLDKDQAGFAAASGTVYEIVGVQKHWGYVDGKYVSDKIGYRIAEVGNEKTWGRVGDVDKIVFVKI